MIRRSAFRPRTVEELASMRRAGRIVALALDEVAGLVAPGVTTAELDEAAEALIRRMGGTPSFKGYHGYPATICTSINEEIVHGIPGSRRLAEGDIISVDAGAIYEGYQGDSARTFPVGVVPDEARRLLRVTEEALYAGIAAARPGNHLSDISHAIEQVARAAGVEVIREYGGHGIGQQMHEPPQVWNWGSPGRGPLLRAGMTLALGPMFALGTFATRQHEDGWTVSTADGSLSAHFEHTVAIADGGGEILTRDSGIA